MNVQEKVLKEIDALVDKLSSVRDTDSIEYTMIIKNIMDLQMVYNRLA